MSELVRADAQTTLDDVRVLIVDDHDLFRSGLRNLLEDEGVHIVGEASAGQEALDIVREVAPDVVVMDLNMPGMGGVEATRHISTIAPLTRVVMLTISDQDNDVIDAILAGACGYLLKDSSIQDLMAGIRAAAAGDSAFAHRVAGALLDPVRESVAATTGQPDLARWRLSNREVQVLELLTRGFGNSDIADQLFLSSNTVKVHATRHGLLADHLLAA